MGPAPRLGAGGFFRFPEPAAPARVFLPSPPRQQGLENSLAGAAGSAVKRPWLARRARGRRSLRVAPVELPELRVRVLFDVGRRLPDRLVAGPQPLHGGVVLRLRRLRVG